MAEMTKAQMKKSHDAMARFLMGLCEYSDKKWNGFRDDDAERRYRKARTLITKAGFKYSPEPPK